MPLEKRGEWWYGDSQDEIPTEIRRYSEAIGFPAARFADAVCHCGGRTFRLALNNDAGVAIRTCETCLDDHFIADSEEFIAKAPLTDNDCFCGEDGFEITVGVSLIDGTEDAQWLYVGCRCPTCGLTGVYGDWEKDAVGARELLDRV